MYRWIALTLGLSTPCQAKPLIHFQKGEIIPAFALKVEKTQAQMLTFHLPPSPPSKSDELQRIQSILEVKLKQISGLKISTDKPNQLSIQFLGPDTPLLQILSDLDVENPKP